MDITKDIVYVGTDDHDLDLFESRYVIPNGISYNSYLIMDEKIAVMDSVDERFSKQWITNIQSALKGQAPSYLIISHMEPDHSGSVLDFIRVYPDAKLVMTQKALAMCGQFFDSDLSDRTVVAGEKDTLTLGKHTLTFLTAPMVHWPEVMVTYDDKDKALFSADAFGKFGALDTDEEWTCEARRYYFNIVGKYGAQVQMMLKKTSAYDIRIICPLHGPVLNDNLPFYIDKYQTWSSYAPEDSGVLIACASVHGNTAKAARKMAGILENKGVSNVVVSDLAREDMAEVIEDAFRYDKMILACSTYDGGLFPAMESFLSLLKSKNYQKRKVGFIENGSWAPMAAKLMRAGLEGCKDLELMETTVTIRSGMKEETVLKMEQLADEILS